MIVKFIVTAFDTIVSIKKEAEFLRKIFDSS